MCTKLAELFANWVVERRNMINTTKGGELALRVCQGKFVSGGAFDFELFCDIPSLSKGG
jgi:hypothetical protein